MLGVTTSAWQSAYLHFSDPLGFRLRRTILNLLSPLCVTPRSGDRSMCKYGFAAARHSFHRPGDYAGQLHTRTHTQHHSYPVSATGHLFAFQGGIQVFTQRPNRLKLSLNLCSFLFW